MASTLLAIMNEVQKCRTCGNEIPAGRRKYCDKHPSEKAEEQKEKSIKKLEEGKCKLCSYDICPESTVFCEKHLLANRQRGVRDRERRKALGLCRSCNDPISEKSTTWCESHHEKQNEMSRKLSEKARAKEMCIDCKSVPRIRRKRRCEPCQEVYLEKKASTCRRMGCDEPVDSKHFCRVHQDEENQKLRDRRERMKAEQKCIFCFNPITDQEDSSSQHVLCFLCREKQKEQRRVPATA